MFWNTDAVGRETVSHVSVTVCVSDGCSRTRDSESCVRDCTPRRHICGLQGPSPIARALAGVLQPPVRDQFARARCVINATAHGLNRGQMPVPRVAVQPGILGRLVRQCRPSAPAANPGRIPSIGASVPPRTTPHSGAHSCGRHGGDNRCTCTCSRTKNVDILSVHAPSHQAC